MKITGNTILVTGGGSGIGRALAESFHALGNQVIIAGRRKQVLDEVTAANPGMKSATLDIEDRAAIRSFAARIAKDYPALNVLINNAGIMRPENLLAQPDDLADAESIITTNLLGPIRLTAALRVRSVDVDAHVLRYQSGDSLLLAIPPLPVERQHDRCP